MIFLSKKEKKAKIAVYFLGVKIFSYHKKPYIKYVGNDNKSYNYANKFYKKFIKTKRTEQPQAQTPTKIIWQIWWQGADNAPKIVKQCLKSIEKYKGDYKVIRVDKDNYKDYVDMPEYIIKKFEKGYFSITHFCDILRCYLLAQNGGIWIDATCLLTKEIPLDIKKADFFIFEHSNKKRKVSVWFMVAKKNNPFINMIKNILTIYAKKTNYFYDYLMFSFMLSYTVDNNEYYKQLFNQKPFYLNDKPRELQFYLLENKKYDIANINKIVKNSFIHKLTYKDKLHNVDEVLSKIKDKNCEDK